MCITIFQFNHTSNKTNDLRINRQIVIASYFGLGFHVKKDLPENLPFLEPPAGHIFFGTQLQFDCPECVSSHGLYRLNLPSYLFP